MYISSLTLFAKVRHVPDWMPGTGFKATARKMRQRLDLVADLPYAFVKHQMRSEKHQTSYISQAISDSRMDPDMERRTHLLPFN